MKLYYIGQHTEKFKCEVCGKSFENESFLKRHQNIHTKPTAFINTSNVQRKLLGQKKFNKHLKGSH